MNYPATHEVVVKFRVHVPHELADQADEVESEVDQLLLMAVTQESVTIYGGEDGDEEYEVELEVDSTEWYPMNG